MNKCNLYLFYIFIFKEHIACHTGYDLYTCPYCPKTFKSSANKYAHVKRGHPFEWDRDRKKPIEFILT